LIVPDELPERVRCGWIGHGFPPSVRPDGLSRTIDVRF
jgi:hypothetical protein